VGFGILLYAKGLKTF